MTYTHDWCPVWLKAGKRARSTSTKPFCCELCGQRAVARGAKVSDLYDNGVVSATVKSGGGLK